MTTCHYDRKRKVKCQERKKEIMKICTNTEEDPTPFDSLPTAMVATLMVRTAGRNEVDLISEKTSAK